MPRVIQFTSESVTEGHPDKFADQVADAVLDDVLAHDPRGRVACEVLASNGLIVVGGEMATTHYVDLSTPERGIVPVLARKIGYTRLGLGLNPEVAVVNNINQQAAQIAAAVIKPEERAAGDQGHMFGYAIGETATLMPLPLHLAHQLALRLAKVRHDGTLSCLRPDGKTQVTLNYDVETRKPVSVAKVVVSPQHDPDIERKELQARIREHVVDPILRESGLDTSATVYNIENEGWFVLGGPAADTGLTGRKIIVDTYGGGSPFFPARHGGGAFSGKDPSKVDRSAAYMARHIAKNIVAAGAAYACEVQLAYEFGVREPTSVFVNTFGTGKRDDHDIAQAVREVFPLRPAQIVGYLDLLKPVYSITTVGGHFGRELPEFTWERTDRVGSLQRALKM